MSLATRCTSCGTVFRVVQDQLRVSSGWVRCGRCGEVFNAVDSLVDLEPERAPDGSASGVQPARLREDTAHVPRGAGVTPPSPRQPDSSQFPATEVQADDPDELPPDPEFTLSPPSTRASPAMPAPALPSTPTPMPGDFSALGGESRARAPAFVRQADRAARWRHPGVRSALVLLILAALAGLAWQVHLSHHDWLAARWPALRPVIERLCGLSACTVEAPRRIESLSVESSGLVRVGAAGTYRLSVSLRNRDRFALSVPAIDLSLTDSQGRMIARRVLRAVEIGVTTAAVEPGAELALTATLRAIDLPVAGYTIEIFYP